MQKVSRWPFPPSRFDVHSKKIKSNWGSAEPTSAREATKRHCVAESHCAAMRINMFLLLVFQPSLEFFYIIFYESLVSLRLCPQKRRASAIKVSYNTPSANLSHWLVDSFVPVFVLMCICIFSSFCSFKSGIKLPRPPCYLSPCVEQEPLCCEGPHLFHPLSRRLLCLTTFAFELLNSRPPPPASSPTPIISVSALSY